MWMGTGDDLFSDAEKQEWGDLEQRLRIFLTESWVELEQLKCVHTALPAELLGSSPGVGVRSDNFFVHIT